MGKKEKEKTNKGERETLICLCSFRFSLHRGGRMVDREKHFVNLYYACHATLKGNRPKEVVNANGPASRMVNYSEFTQLWHFL